MSESPQYSQRRRRNLCSSSGISIDIRFTFDSSDIRIHIGLILNKSLLSNTLKADNLSGAHNMKLSLAFALVLGCVVFAYAQDPAAVRPVENAPGKWTRFKLTEEKISIEFPRLPVRTDSENVCTQSKSSLFFSYSDGTVYEMQVVGRTKGSIPEWCTDRSIIGEKSITGRISDIRQRMQVTETSERLWNRNAKVLHRSSRIERYFDG